MYRFESDDEIPKILSKILSLSSNRKQIEKIQKFAEKKNLDVKTALKDAKMNLKWAEKYVPIIKKIITKMV